MTSPFHEQTACLSVSVSVKLVPSSLYPLPCGPFSSLRPIIEPCMAIGSTTFGPLAFAIPVAEVTVAAVSPVTSPLYTSAPWATKAGVCVLPLEPVFLVIVPLTSDSTIFPIACGS